MLFFGGTILSSLQPGGCQRSVGWVGLWAWKKRLGVVVGELSPPAHLPTSRPHEDGSTLQAVREGHALARAAEGLDSSGLPRSPGPGSRCNSLSISWCPLLNHLASSFTPFPLIFSTAGGTPVLDVSFSSLCCTQVGWGGGGRVSHPLELDCLRLKAATSLTLFWHLSCLHLSKERPSYHLERQDTILRSLL